MRIFSVLLVSICLTQSSRTDIYGFRGTANFNNSRYLFLNQLRGNFSYRLFAPPKGPKVLNSKNLFKTRIRQGNILEDKKKVAQFQPNELKWILGE